MNDTKKIKSLISSCITGNSNKTYGIVKELLESIIEKNQDILIDNYFSNIRKGIKK